MWWTRGIIFRDGHVTAWGQNYTKDGLWIDVMRFVTLNIHKRSFNIVWLQHQSWDSFLVNKLFLIACPHQKGVGRRFSSIWDLFISKSFGNFECYATLNFLKVNALKKLETRKQSEQNHDEPQVVSPKESKVNGGATATREGIELTKASLCRSITTGICFPPSPKS